MDKVNAEIEVEPVPIVVIVDLKNAYTADVAAARTLRKISQKCTEKDIRLKIVTFYGKPYSMSFEMIPISEWPILT